MPFLYMTETVICDMLYKNQPEREHMAKVKWKPGTMLSPLPAALISCGDMERPNVMTAAWTGIVNSKPPRAYVSIRPERYSYGLIKESGVFVINVTTDRLKYAVDFCGVKSGREEDKFKACALTPQRSFEVECPSVEESPISLECRVFKVVELGSHDMFMADIAAVSVDDSLIDENDRLKLEDASILSYIHGGYFEQGRYAGHFGWSVKKDKNRGKRGQR